MSSSNLVRVAVIEEITYGEVPAVGDFKTSRFTSESLSGSPETTESQQIRVDRMSSGQVVTGLTVGGDQSFELAKDSTFDLFLESAMYNSWQISSLQTLDMDIDKDANTIDRASGDFATQVSVGDIITLSGFSNTSNNTQVMVSKIVSPTQIKFIGPVGLVTESGSGTAFKVADKLVVGSTKKSFSMEKAFLDLAANSESSSCCAKYFLTAAEALGSLATAPIDNAKFPMFLSLGSKAVKSANAPAPTAVRAAPALVSF